ncbi:MAG: hypothetical protein GXO32_00980 [Crenarchaeota archaeon]|nr:hypothetical protein [Thermoproteota archaeon]
MRKAVAAIASAGIAIAIVLSLPIIALEIHGGSVKLVPLELIPRSNVSSILLAKVSNPSPLTLTVKLSARIYVNSSLALTYHDTLYLGSGESKLVRISIPMPVKRGSIAYVSIKGSEEIYPKLLLLPSLVPVTAKISEEALVHVSPCFIRVVAAGFRPQVAVVGQHVVAWVKLYSSDSCTASVAIRILEDITVGTGIPLTTKIFYVRFPGTYTLNITWTPPYPSSTSLRGYYLAVYINGTNFYVMPPMYPPRLKVLLTPPKTTTSSPAISILVSKAWWIVNGRKGWVAKVGEEVSGCVEIVAERPWSGYVTIKILEDSPVSNVVASNSVPISVSPTKPATICVSFYPRAPSSKLMRGYYIVVDVGKATIYVMPPSYPPRLEVSR